MTSGSIVSTITQQVVLEPKIHPSNVLQLVDTCICEFGHENNDRLAWENLA